MEDHASHDGSSKPRSQGSKAFNWFIGCGLALIVLTLLCGGGAWWGFGIFKEKAIEAIHGGAVEAVEESKLPEDQVDSILIDLERLRTAAHANSIKWEEIENLEQEFARISALGAIQWYEAYVLPDVKELSQEEHADAARQLQRLSRGLQDDSVSVHALETLEVRISDDEMEHGLDAEDVRRLIVDVRRIVNDAGVPDEPFQVDVAVDFTRLVDALIEY